MSTDFPRRPPDQAKIKLRADDEIQQARLWCVAHPDYTIRFDLCNRFGGISVQGIWHKSEEPGKVVTYSTGQNIGKHVLKVLRRLEKHVETGSVWNDEEHD
jgi:hypothetical protein